MRHDEGEMTTRPPKDELEDACARWGWDGAAEEYEVDEATIIRWLRAGEEATRSGPRPKKKSAPKAPKKKSAPKAPRKPRRQPAPEQKTHAPAEHAPYKGESYERLAALYREHGSCVTAAALAGVSPKTVLKAARACGVSVPIKTHGWAPPVPRAPVYDREEMVRLYCQGMTVREVGAKMGCSYTLVASVVRARGSVRRVGKRPSAKWDAIAYLIDETALTVKEVCSIIGCANTTVHRACDERGVFRRLPRAGARRTELVEAVEAGQDDRQISCAMGVTLATVARWRDQLSRVRS